MQISATNISKTLQGKTLFENISFTINKGDKIGLIGINGCGKSTLLKILSNIEEPDYTEDNSMNSSIRFAARLKISYLEQDPQFNDDLNVVQQVLDYADIDEEYKAKSSLNMLGFDDYDLKVANLSGGQRRKLALCACLLKNADIYILDEPTNHLDENMVNYIENELRKTNKTIIMVTHDRYFLDRVTNQIFELSNKQLFIYSGNYNYYLEQKANRLANDKANERKRKSLLRSEQKWMNQGAKARGTKSKERIERFNKLKNIKVDTVDELDINSIHSRLGSKVIDIENIKMEFDGELLFDNFSYQFTKYDRVGLLGLNGCGKSTFLNLIAQKLKPTSGSITLGSTVKLGYFSQHTYHLPQDETVIDYIRDIAEFIETPNGKVSAGALLERFLFNPNTFQKQINVLSGGEKRRLFLLSLIMKNPNVLILDEPTNDLDIETLTVLEQYLDNFQGVIIVVSHDRYFLDKVVDKLFVFTPQKQIELYHGDYSSYVEEYNRSVSESKPKSVKKGKAKINGKQKYKFSYKEKQDFETIDDQIIELEEEIAALDTKIAENSSDFQILNQLITNRNELDTKLNELNERWEYLMDLSIKIENNEYIDD